MKLPFTTIWIIGASTGIGRAAALAFARAGVSVAVSARSSEGLATLVSEGDGRIHAFPLDVTDAEAVRNTAEQIEAKLGDIQALLYCAASWSNDRGSQATAATLRSVYEVNIFGCLNVLEVILPNMKARGNGRIALVSSVAGFRGLPRALAYGSSKAALTHIAEALKFECDPLGVIVQVIHPGFVKTPLTDKNDFPMPFMMTPQAAADRIVRGMNSSGFEITFPRRFTYLLKLLRLLPYRLYFWLVSQGTRGKI
jgi:NAD(P)-dependent dehydrogenase (short-subunit alcohol dehydrogenase family)